MINEKVCEIPRQGQDKVEAESDDVAKELKKLGLLVYHSISISIIKKLNQYLSHVATKICLWGVLPIRQNA